MGSAPFHAPTERLIPATKGLLVQGSNLGIVLGPPLLSGVATAMGWQWVPLLTILAAALATLSGHGPKLSSPFPPRGLDENFEPLRSRHTRTDAAIVFFFSHARNFLSTGQVITRTCNR